MNTIVFSVVVPVYNTRQDLLLEMIRSVTTQTYPHWQLVLVNDASPDLGVSGVLAAAAVEDRRIVVVERAVNGGIVAASNDGIAAATGDFVALLDHDDLLAPEALERVAEAIRNGTNVDYVYTDEDKVTTDGTFYDRFDKPSWSPERLRGQMYTSHLSVIRTSLVREVGAFRPGFDGSQDHDLILRVTERARGIVHIPEVLYHWRAVEGSTALDIDSKSYAWDAGVRAVDEHLKRSGIKARAVRGPVPGTYTVEREPQLDRSVSVIIPTRGTRGVVFGEERVFVVEAVRSLLEKTAHRDLEIVVVYDAETDPAVLTELSEIAGDRLTPVLFSGVFNFSRKCNAGVLASRGDAVVFLNDDVQAISDEIVGQLLAPLDEPDVGMTGALLLFEDGTIQHAGHQHHDANFTHAYFGYTADAYGAFSSLLFNREASGLTAACIAMPRSVFLEAGGFSESLPGNFNDVDLCLKVGTLGYRLVWLRGVQLYHFESKSRVTTVQEWEQRILIDRWGLPERDPFLA